MILKKLLNLQDFKSKIRNFVKKNNEIFDIIIYGSITKGKMKINDIDLAILLKQKASVSKKLLLSQKLKHKLKKLDYKFDIKTVDIYDLLDKDFMARQGIISSGYLILKNKNISELFGFKAYSIFTYDLKGLSNSQKTLFRYVLNGRRKQEGLLKITNSNLLGRGSLRVPIIYSEEFKELFEKYNIGYKIQDVLIYQ